MNELHEVRYISPAKGRGMFALKDIPKGKVFEVVPVVPLKKGTVLVPELWPLPFEWKDTYCLIFGNFQFANHSATHPNCKWAQQHDTMTIRAWATRDIKAGDEIVYDYECELWFEAVED